MSIRISQLLTALFAISLVISPPAMAFDGTPSPTGEDQAPVQNDAPTDDVMHGDDGADDVPVGEGEETEPKDAGTLDSPLPANEEGESSNSTPAAEPTADQQEQETDELVTKSDTPEGEVQPAAISGDFDIALEYVYPMSWIEIELSFDVGFTASAGDTMFLRWDKSSLDTEVVEVDGITLPLNWDFSDPDGATLAFRNDYVATTDVTGIVRLYSQWELLPYDACVLSPDPYQSETHLQFSIGSSAADTRSATIRVGGPMCPGSPYVWGVGYVPRLNAVYATIRVPNNSIAGESVSITYPTQRIHLDPGSFNVYMFAGGPGSEVVIGTAVVTEGLVTITFDDFPPTTAFAWATLPATVIAEACVPGGGLQIIDIEPITFIGIPGSVWSNDFEQMLCDAAPITKVGRWISDTEIEWTIDTGDLLRSATIYDTAYDLPFTFNCADDDVTVETPAGYEVPADAPIVDCFADSLTVELPGDSIQRAEITFRTTIDVSVPATSYVNCAYSEVNRGDMSESFDLTATVNTAGLGGSACYELFPEGGGDFLSNTVDKPEVESGETVTFTINVATSSDEWLSIALNGVLPGGFEIDETSITCGVLPLDYQGTPCVTRVGNELHIVVLPLPDGDSGVSAPVNITLSFSGSVTGSPGDVIANEACSERTVPDHGLTPMVVSGDPTIPGGGVICESAAVTIIEGDDEVTTPSPTPMPTGTAVPTGTVTPGTPTSEASPSAPADPTATSGVTSLPETGVRGSSAGSSFFIVALSTGILIAAGTGVPLKSRRD